jgi:hypothetical protein
MDELQKLPVISQAIQNAIDRVEREKQEKLKA